MGIQNTKANKLLTTKGSYGACKTEGQVRAHLDDINIHHCMDTLNWWAPIGNIANTTVLGYFVDHSTRSPSGGVGIAASSGGLECSIGATAAGGTGGFRSLIAASVIAQQPTICTSFKITSAAGTQLFFGFYKDADEYCYVRTSGAAVRYLINDSSGAASGNWALCSELYEESGVPTVTPSVPDDTYVKGSMSMDTDGKPYFRVERGNRLYVFTLPDTETTRMSSGAHYWEVYLKAAPGEVAYLKVANIHWSSQTVIRAS